MGINIHCDCNQGNGEICVNTTRLKQLERKYTQEDNIKKIILIQSIYKGYIFREHLKENIKFQLLKKATNISSNTSLKYNYVKKLDINTIFEKYPMIDQFKDMNLILKPPYEFPNKRQIYYGEWKGEERYGRGVQQWLDGSRYEGYFIDGKANIKGKLFHSNGDTYDGEWRNNKANGYGIYLHVGGEYYDGQWKDDKQDGKGKETWIDGSSYEGEYNSGKRHGKGIFKWPDGSEYEGDFVNNMFNGKGKYTWSDKREYIGEWEANQMNGYGIFKWPDGRKYQGDYKKDKKEGYGLFYWPDGRIFKGFWSNGKQHGEGEFYDPKKNNWKKGVWENGKNIRFYEDHSNG